MEEKEIGVISSYFDHVGVAAIKTFRKIEYWRQSTHKRAYN